MPGTEATAAPAARRRRTAEGSRAELIEAAIAVIGRKGLSGTTLTDVAAKAGIGYGNVTFRFKNKSALLLAALREVTSEYVEWREAAAAGAQGSAAERLDAMVVASFHPKVTSHKKVALWHAFLSECHIHSEYRKLFAEIFDREYKLTKEIVEEIARSETGNCPDPHTATRGINSLIEGLWFGMRIGPKPLERGEAQQIARTFLASLFPTAFSKLSFLSQAKPDAGA